MFDDHPRTDPSPQRESELTISFLDRVADPVFDRVRALLNQWTARYPAPERTDLVSRLQSRDDRQFTAAFWELYLFEVHRSLGYAIELHPALPGNSNRPDFLLERDGKAFYLEATIATEADEVVKEKRRVDQIYDALNRLESPDFWLLLDVKEREPTAPPVGPLRRELEQWLAGLDWTTIRQAVDADKFYELPRFSKDVNGWTFLARAFPKKPDMRGRLDVRPIGNGPDEGGWLPTRDPIKRVLERKAGHYGQPDRPLILAVNVDRPFASEDDFCDALLGTPKLQPAQSGADPWEWARREDGLWGSRERPNNEAVVGVLGAFWVRPWSVASAIPVLWSHLTLPSLGPEFGPWPRWEVADDQRRRRAGTFVPTELELPRVGDLADPADWPGRPFAQSP